MTLRWYLAVMAITSSVCWAMFAYIINTVNPEITNWVGFMLFYGALFLSLVGTFSVLGFFVRFILLKKELIFRSVKEAFRQSFLLSFLCVACLYLLSKNLFTWMNVVALAVCLTVLELFLVSYHKN